MWPFTRNIVQIEQRQTLEELAKLIFGDDTDSIVVTASTSLTCSTVHAAVRILSESISQLPLHLYRKGNDGSRKRETDHPLETVIADMASPGRTAFAFRLQAMVDVCTHGNSFAVIVRNSRKQVIELHRVSPDKVAVKQDETTLAASYEISQGKGPVKVYPFGDVLHLRWLSTDGLKGESPVELAKDDIKLALGIQRYAARLFRNGGRPPGYLKGAITDRNKEKVKKGFMASITGQNGPDDVPMLGEVDFVKVAFSAVEAELQALSLQTMRRILAIYRVPPPIYGDLEKSNYSNAEFSGRMFLQHALLPFLKQWETEIRAKCLTPAERKSLYVEHLVDDIVRADIAARFEAYGKAVTNGILSPNEVRAMENRPAYAGGDQFRLPLNTENPNKGGEDA